MAEDIGDLTALTAEIGDRLLHPRDVARILGLSRQHVYRLGERGQLRTIRLGGAVRIPLSAG